MGLIRPLSGKRSMVLTRALGPLAVVLSLLAVVSPSIVPANAAALEQALSYANKHKAQFQQELLDIAKIPSISSLPEHQADMQAAANWVASKLKEAGMEGVQILKAGRHPVVYGGWTRAAGMPTVLIYAHYDVQPVDPLELWQHPPFEPVIKDGWFLGRGTDDNKGGMLNAVQAVEAYLKSSGSLPVNVKFCIEGMEEIGSPGLGNVLAANAELMAADFALSADGSQISELQFGIMGGLRGAVTLQVELQTLAGDVHSGLKGGSVLNPIHALADMVASLHDASGKIAVEGFYDKVVPLSDETRARIAANPFDAPQDLADIGALQYYGEEGFSPLEQRWLRPTVDINGIYGGFSGAGVKTIVPAKATAKVSSRIVPNQDPDEVLQMLVKHFEDRKPAAANLTIMPQGFRAPPYTVDPAAPTTAAAFKVLGEVSGTEPLFAWHGGTIPAPALFEQHLGVKTVMFGFGLPDDNIHGPNERYRVSMFEKGREAYIRVFNEMAERAADTKTGRSDGEL